MDQARQSLSKLTFETLLAVLKLEEVDEVVLCGHSYRGMVTALRDDVVRTSRLATPAQSLLARLSLRRAGLEIHRWECAFIRTCPDQAHHHGFGTTPDSCTAASAPIHQPIATQKRSPKIAKALCVEIPPALLATAKRGDRMVVRRRAQITTTLGLIP